MNGNKQPTTGCHTVNKEYHGEYARAMDFATST